MHPGFRPLSLKFNTMARVDSGLDRYLRFGLTSMRSEVRFISNILQDKTIETKSRAEVGDNSQETRHLVASRTRTRQNRTFHRHNEIEVVLLEKGTVGNLIGGELVRFHAGRLAVFWGAVPHAPVEITPGATINWLTIPFSWFLEWQLPQVFTEAMLKGKTLIERDDKGGSSDLALFYRWHRDLRSGSADLRKVVLLECEARLRRLVRTATIVPAGKVRTSEAEQGSSGHVEQMIRFIATHYTEPLRVADVAAHTDLHSNYAAVLFRRSCGISLLNYVKEHRIFHAQRLLATTNEKIVTIALSAGFGSASRFYCAFKKACGSTPRAYRRAMSSLFEGQSRPG